MEIRLPYVAGAFYPGHADVLLKAIKDCFLDKEFGPGGLPEGKIEGLKVIGGVAPHAGYVYSGPCAAHLYKRIAESNTDNPTVVILGTNHTGFGPSVSMNITRDWQTPLGVVKTDREFGRALLDSGIVLEDESAHNWEHSVEVQLPFLQYIFHDDFKIVPIVLSRLSVNEIRRLGDTLYEVSKDYDRDVIVIASSDFTHHGYNYGYVLFKENEIENVTKLDLSFIEEIKNLDLNAFLEKLRKVNATVCGYSSIATLMEFSRHHGAKVNLLKYYNSGELTGDSSLIVGYAAISFEK